jgi:hypothetical protein
MGEIAAAFNAALPFGNWGKQWEKVLKTRQ